MTSKKISLSEKFKDLLLSVEGNNVKRKELIKIAMGKFGLTAKQAEGFIARNVHYLQRKHLIEASGYRGERSYYLSSSLKCIIEHKNSTFSDLLSESLPSKGNDELSREETKIQVSLEMVLSELNAYYDLHERFPHSRAFVKHFLNEAKKESIQLHGKLNALKKIILATNQKNTLS